MAQRAHADAAQGRQLSGGEHSAIEFDVDQLDQRPIKPMRLVRFDGERYVLFSDVIASE